MTDSFVLDVRGSTPEEKIAHFEQVREQMIRQRRPATVAGIVLFAAVLVGSSITGRVNIARLRHFPDILNYVRETIPTLRLPYLGHDLARWFARGHVWMNLIFDTALIAFLSTLISTVLAFVFCFPASRNLMRNTVVYFVFRRILAIAVHSTGSLGKLFSEVNENIDQQPIEGIRSTGGNWFQIIRFAVVPQVLPNFASYALLRLEINIRAATVIGLVGAGGIGMELMFAIRQFQYRDISAMCVLIIAIVIALDYVCEYLRHRLIGKEHLL